MGVWLGFVRAAQLSFKSADPAAFEAAICPRTKAVLLEAPGNLTIEVCDVPALSRRRAGACG